MLSDPVLWIYDISPESKEVDDWVHSPDENIDDTGSIFTARGASALGCIAITFIAIFGIFFFWPLEIGIKEIAMRSSAKNATEAVRIVHRSKYRDDGGGDYAPLGPQSPLPPPRPPAKGFITNQFALSPDPRQWGYNTSPKQAEPDDWLHIPDKHLDDNGSIFSARGISSLGCIGLVFLSTVGVFFVWPLQNGIRKMLKDKHLRGFNLGGINATVQVFESAFVLIDKDTPANVRRKASPVDNREMVLVFSDEFEIDVLAWYDPQQAYTKDGQLWIEMAEVEKPEDNHNLKYVSAMITRWNKLCFTGGLIEASVQLPGSPKVQGFWVRTLYSTTLGCNLTRS
ncbi:probable KRE6-glucan synthase subunit, partial [Serendipita indica DSM 11827]